MARVGTRVHNSCIEYSGHVYTWGQSKQCCRHRLSTTTNKIRLHTCYTVCVCLCMEYTRIVAIDPIVNPKNSNSNNNSCCLFFPYLLNTQFSMELYFEFVLFSILPFTRHVTTTKRTAAHNASKQAVLLFFSQFLLFLWGAKTARRRSFPLSLPPCT